MSPIDEPRKRVGNPSQKLQKKSRTWLYIALVLIIVVIAVGAYVLYNSSPKTNNNGSNNENPVAVITTSMGTIKVELFRDKVPNTVDNFIKLANINFYNGLVFHRVINDFMIQGGGFYPNGTQKISPFDPINLEINPNVHHLDGTIAMARTSDPNSATSQFFIDDGPQSQLEPGGVDPNGYAAFGIVIEGIDVVHAIAVVDTTTKYGSYQNWPVEDIIINSITINTT